MSRFLSRKAKKVSIPTTDFEKWRGVTLDINHLDQQISTAKEVVVHYDPDSMHKILVAVKPENTATNWPQFCM